MRLIVCRHGVYNGAANVLLHGDNLQIQLGEEIFIGKNVMSITHPQMQCLCVSGRERERQDRGGGGGGVGGGIDTTLGRQREERKRGRASSKNYKSFSKIFFKRM